MEGALVTLRYVGRRTSTSAIHIVGLCSISLENFFGGMTQRPGFSTLRFPVGHSFLTDFTAKRVATIPADKGLYQRQIEAGDRQIDALVYQLYGLMREKIDVMEKQS